MPRPIHRDRAIVERDIADHVHVRQPRVVGRRKNVDPEPEIVEKDVVLDPFHRVVARRVDPVVQVLVGAVVVHDAAGDFGIPVRGAMVDSLPPGVVDDHVDQAGPGRVNLHVTRQGRIAERIGLHDLEAPEPDVRPLHPQVAVDRRSLARILAHDDRGGRGAGERAREHAGVRPSAQPDRVSRLHLAARAGETRDQVPRPGPAPCGLTCPSMAYLREYASRARLIAGLPVSRWTSCPPRLANNGSAKVLSVITLDVLFSMAFQELFGENTMFRITTLPLPLRICICWLPVLYATMLLITVIRSELLDR